WNDDPRLRKFYAYDRTRGQVQVTDDFEAFLRCVGALPTGCRIARLEKCCSPFEYGMPRENDDRLYAAMQAGKKTLVPLDAEDAKGDELSVCTCESIALRFPAE